MDDRGKPPPRAGVKPNAGVGLRSSSPLANAVRERLLNDPVWSFFAQNGKWICPYCLSAVVKRQGRSREDSIALHLEGCRAYSAGRGHAQAQNVVAERMHFENMTYQAENNPSWRVYDHEGVWFCPACLDRVTAVRLQGGQLNNFVFQAMAGHLRACAAYRQGIVYPASDIQRARDLSARAPGLAQVVAAQLQFSVWRYLDPAGAWVCPCCLAHIPEITISNPADWQYAADPITKHLLLRCPSFSVERLETQPEPLVQQAASVGAVPPGAAQTPSGVARAQPPSAPQRQGARPPVARPASGAQPVVGSQQPTPPQGRPPIRTQRSVTSQSLPPAAKAPTPLPTSPLSEGSRVDPLAGTTLEKVASDRVTPTPGGSQRVDAKVGEATPGGSPRADIKITDWEDEVPNAGAPEPTQNNRTDVIHARNLQASMFVQSPELPGYKFATRYEACSDITGDFYEFITLADGRIGFALGDVSGHGVQAGLVMSMAKKTLEIYASLGAGPAETLAKVNDALTRDLGGKMFISMIYGILSPESQDITWARAGGTPALRYNSGSGALGEIKPPGMVLGMKSGQTFRQSLKEEVTQLAKGDVLLLYTDGVTETMNAEQEEWGTERLNDLLKRAATAGPEALLSQVMEEVKKFRGTLPVSDDVTLLALAVE